MPKKPPSKNGEPIVIATFDYIAKKSEELTFNKGDILEITKKKTNGWWFGFRYEEKSANGWVPSNFCEEFVVLGDAYLTQDVRADTEDDLSARKGEWVYVIGEDEENETYLCAQVSQGKAGHISAAFLGQDDEEEGFQEMEEEEEVKKPKGRSKEDEARDRKRREQEEQEELERKEKERERDRRREREREKEREEQERELKREKERERERQKRKKEKEDGTEKKKEKKKKRRRRKKIKTKRS